MVLRLSIDYGYMKPYRYTTCQVLFPNFRGFLHSGEPPTPAGVREPSATGRE